ncbi:MAG: ABC transporter ATP-binding protein [Pirellula sp.]|jgi:putative ABC transport system ATP-binding protein|nr:ABC transporter ATP-binding protein [Pirellula sp.]
MLNITNLKKSYREPTGENLPILDIPQFSIAAGEQVVLRGESGCGKTTLLHIISGLVPCDSGSILLDGVELTKYSEAGRDRIRAAKMGYVFQTFNLLPAFTAIENVKIGMKFSRKGVSHARAKELLEKVGLGSRLNYLPKQLSVGQQQRVAVARALANQPRLLLADEPTANVDPANQTTIIELIQEVCRTEQVAILIVTHSDEVARKFDRIDRFEEINMALSHRAVKPAPSSTHASGVEV